MTGLQGAHASVEEARRRVGQHVVNMISGVKVMMYEDNDFDTNMKDAEDIFAEGIEMQSNTQFNISTKCTAVEWNKKTGYDV